jgi:hypothetical protein
MKFLLIIGILWVGAACSVIRFDEYDYETHENAHIDVTGIDADVHKVHGGLLVGKKFKFGNPRKLTIKEAKE